MFLAQVITWFQRTWKCANPVMYAVLTFSFQGLEHGFVAFMWSQFYKWSQIPLKRTEMTVFGSDLSLTSYNVFCKTECFRPVWFSHSRIINFWSLLSIQMTQQNKYMNRERDSCLSPNLSLTDGNIKVFLQFSAKTWDYALHLYLFFFFNAALPRLNL